MLADMVRGGVCEAGLKNSSASQAPLGKGAVHEARLLLRLLADAAKQEEQESMDEEGGASEVSESRRPWLMKWHTRLGGMVKAVKWSRNMSTIFQHAFTEHPDSAAAV